MIDVPVSKRVYLWTLRRYTNGRIRRSSAPPLPWRTHVARDWMCSAGSGTPCNSGSLICKRFLLSFLLALRHRLPCVCLSDPPPVYPDRSLTATSCLSHRHIVTASGNTYVCLICQSRRMSRPRKSTSRRLTKNPDLELLRKCICVLTRVDMGDTTYKKRLMCCMVTCSWYNGPV
jgi:hypothetical protein